MPDAALLPAAAPAPAPQRPGASGRGAAPADAVPGRRDPVRRLRPDGDTAPDPAAAAPTADTDVADAAAPPSYLTGAPPQQAASAGDNSADAAAAGMDDAADAGAADADGPAAEPDTDAADGDGAAAADQAQREDAARRQDGAQSADGDQTQAPAGAQPPPAPAAAAGDGALERVQAEAALPELPIAVLGIALPEVPSPPAAARERAEQIRSRTGKPPALHHAQVRQAMAALVAEARAGQRRIVFDTEHLARETGHALLLLTQPVAAALAGGIARIEHGIEQAVGAVDRVADAALAHLNAQEQQQDEQGRRKRAEVVQEVHDQLIGNDAAMREAYDALSQAFRDQYLGEAKKKVTQILDTGKVELLAIPDFPPPKGAKTVSSDKPPEPRCAKPKVTRTMDNAKERLAQWIKDQDSGAVGRWVETRTEPILERDHQVAHGQRKQELDRRAAALETYASRFLSVALGITTPVGTRYRALMEQRPKEAQQAFATDAERRAADFARYRRQLEDKRRGVKDYLRGDLKPRLVRGLRKAARKAMAGLRRQARTVERSLAATAPALAEAYPELVARAAALLPPEQFLDVRRIGPLLHQARASAADLPDQQLGMLTERAQGMHERMAAGAADTAAKLGEQASTALRGIDDVKQGVAVDMSLFVSQSTGVLTAAMGETLTAAQGYAKRRIVALAATRDDPEGQLARTMAGFAAGINQDLGCACSAYNDAVEAYRVRMEDRTLATVVTATREDLSKRSQQADDAMPRRSLGTGGMVALTVATPIGGAYYAYATRAKPDQVFDAIGGLPWPGPPAVEATFNAEKSDTLRGRAKAVLDDDDADTATNLLSSDALTRKRARDQVVEDSLGIFSGDAWFGNSRKTRENLLRAQAFELMPGGAAAGQVSAAERERTQQMLADKLSGPALNISTSYLDLDPAAALAARIEERRVQARDRGDEELFRLGADLERMTREEFALSEHGAALTPDEVQGHFNDAVLAFARQRTGADQQPAASGQTPEQAQAQARATFIHAMTAPRDRMARERAFADPTAGLNAHNRGEAVGRPTRRYIEDLTHHGLASDQAWASKAAYETQRAEGETFGPSEDSEHRVTLALEDQRLARLRRDLEEKRDYYAANPAAHQAALNALNQAKQDRAKRLRLLATRLAGDDAARNAPAGQADQAATAAAARVADLRDDQVTASVSTRTQRLFSGVQDVHNLRTDVTGAADLTDADKRARYARELVEGGRASVTSTTYLATAGAGTNEALLEHGFTGRSAGEMAAARGQWRREEGSDFDRFLGLGDQGGFGSEVSGDLAGRLTDLAYGEPVTDRDHMAQALRRERFQRVQGTGGLGRAAMAGSDEQQFMQRKRSELAEQIIAAARANAPPGTEIPNDPGAVLGRDGRIAEPYATYAFGPGPNDATLPPGSQGGRFRGNRIAMRRSMDHLNNAARNYQAELDRQESIVTGAITTLAVVISVALMLIPGVNLVAAGVITALVAGAATMAAKAGMRGGRYGWEEAATDAAQTAIEATLAGAGGALAGGLGTTGRVTGKLAAVGNKLTGSFGRVGGAVVREGLTGAIGGVAQTAIQDQTWQQGIGKGFEALLKAGGRGAAVGAVAAGVSEGLDAKLTRQLARGADPDDLSRMAGLSRRLGPKAGGMLREGIGESLGSMAGETAGVLFDVGTGKHKGTFDDALAQIGQAGLKDLWAGAARNRVMARNRTRYRQLHAAAVRSGSPSDAQLRALRLAGISAGEVFPRQDIDSVAAGIQATRNAAAVLPPDLRRVALDQGMSAETIQGLLARLQGDTGADASERRELIADLVEKHPGLDVSRFMADLDVHVSRRERAQAAAQAAPDPARRAQRDSARGALTAQLPPAVRDRLGELDPGPLAGLPPAGLRAAADMVQRGVYDQDTADALLRTARAADPELDQAGFLQALRGAVELARHAQVQASMDALRERRRAEVAELLPDAARTLVADLDDGEVLLVHRLLEAGSTGTPAQRSDLLESLRGGHPDLDGAGLEAVLAAGVERAAARRTAAVAAARAQRAERLSNVPAELRDTLAALPEHALVLLRAAQAQDRDLRPAERARMLDDALRTDPDLDRQALAAALDAALAAGRGEQGQTPADRARLRAALLDSVPAAQRHLVADTPVIVMRADEFAAMTRSASGQAVTMLIHGEPVVVLREGADPSALGEEGLHVLQARDPDWARHIEALDEVSLADWQRMPLAERIARYGNKLDLEIDAQQRRIADLKARLGDTDDPAERRRLADQLELTRTALANLSRRADEVAALTPATIQAMAAGVLHRPRWLEQPPRLFQKDSRAPPAEPTAPGPSLTQRIDAAEAAPHLDVVRPLLAEVAALSPAHPLHARLARVIDALPADAQARLRDEIIGDTELARLAAAAGARPSALRKGAQALHPLELQGLLRLELDPVLAGRLIRTSGAESGAHGPPSVVRDLLAVAAAAGPEQIATLAARVASVERVDHRREVAAHLRIIAGAIKQPDTLAALLASLPVRDRGSPDARFVPSALAPARRLVEAAGDAAQLRRLAEHLAQASEAQKAALLEPLAREPSLLALVELDAVALPGLLRQAAALSHLGDGAEAAIGNFVHAVQRHAAGLSAGNSARLFAGLSRMEVATGQQRSALRVALAMLVVAEGVHLDVADIPALRRALIDAVVDAAAHKPDIAEALGRVFPALGADAQGQLADLLAKGGDAARIGLLEAVAQLRRTLGELDVPEMAPDALLADLLAVARDQDQYVAFLTRTERLLRAAKDHETERRAAAEAGAADDHKPGLRDLVDYLRAGRDDASRRAALGPDVHRADNRLDTKVGIDKLLGGLGHDPPSLAEGDAWVQQLAEADARWQDQVQRTPKPLYAALVEDATPQPPWSDGQRGTLLEHAPWLALRLRFEIETRLAQGDPPVVLDQPALSELLGALRTGLATGAADTGLRFPVGTDTLVLTRTELAAMLKGIIDARQPTTAAQHSRIARAFRDSAADASRRVQQSLNPDAATVEQLLDRVSASGAARESEVLREHLINLYQQQVRYALLVTYTDVLGTGAEGLKQQVTEVIGELALTRFMLEREPTPTLIGPFEKGTGFDQVWRDPDGTLLVCEAKGPGAKLGEPDKGEQMTGQWVLATLLEMIRAGDSPKVDGDQLGDLLLRAALTGDPRLRGEVVQASDSSSTAGTSIAQAKHGRPHYALRDADLFDDPYIRGLLATPRVRSKLEAMLTEMPQDDPFVRRVLGLLAEAAEA